MANRPASRKQPKASPERESRASQNNKGETERLIRAWKRRRDPALREKLISQHLYLVQAVARKFAGLGESPEDLASEGMMGLLNAVELFDPKKGAQFATYATHLIDGQIRHYLRDKSKLIREPAWVQERLTRITRAAEALAHRMGRPAALAEIADCVGLSERQVAEALKSQERTRVASLDGVHSPDGDEADSRPGVERLIPLSSEASGLEVEDHLFLQSAIGRLKALEQKVLHHFYYFDLNQTEIARKLGISVNYASYLLRGALGKLKQAFETQAKAAVESSPVGIMERHCQERPALYCLHGSPQREGSSAALASEAHFRQALTQEVQRAVRYPQQFALLFVEPDGAAEWDEQKIASAMAELALRTRQNVRMVDLVARMGRWRLGLLLPHTGREAAVVVERLRRQLNPKGTGTHFRSHEIGSCPQFPLTLSVGLAVFPLDGADEAALEEHALRGLLQAQKNGGDQVCRAAASPTPPKPTRARKKK